MKILAFDQSTAKTGWAFFIDDQLINYGVINKSSNKDAPDRIRDMFLSIIEIIQDTEPDWVIVESVQQQASPATSMMLSQLQGMIIGYLYEHEIAVDSPLPTQWRKALGFHQGKGIKRAELKDLAKKFVLDTFNINVCSDDEADAICIGVAMYKLSSDNM